MSCYERERGEFRLPSEEAAKFRRALVEVYNKQQEEAYQAALRAYGKIIAAAKGRRMKPRDWYDVAERIIWQHDRRGYSIENPHAEAIISSLWRKGGHRMHYRPLKPRKMDFPTKPVSKPNVTFAFEDASIVVMGRRVVWHVDENNHAVERAKEDPLGQTFFGLLRRVNWTRGTGGYIQYHNEYMEWEGPSITEACGPLGERMLGR